MAAASAEHDQARRRRQIKTMAREIADQGPHVWLPISQRSIALLPGEKNYNGELRAGSVRPGPIYARIGIDQDLKKRMGFN